MQKSIIFTNIPGKKKENYTRKTGVNKVSVRYNVGSSNLLGKIFRLI